jgi:elongation factor Ts
MLLTTFARQTLLRSAPVSFASFSSASLVKTLRQKTGAPILECKKALDAEDGDLERAVDYLRKSGVAAAAKRSGVTATEGLVAVAVSEDGRRGVVVELNSETDFVARNSMFQGILSNIASVALEVAPAEHQAVTTDITQQLLASSITTEDGTTSTVSDAVTHLSGVIRENILLRRASMMSLEEGKGGMIGHYVHSAIGPNQGAIGCMVAIGVDDANSGDDSFNDLETVGRSVSLHIAAARPAYLNTESIPAEELEREKSIHMELGLASGKKPEIVEKMVSGRMRKFFEENVLVNQKSVVDDDGLPMSKLVAKSREGAEIRGFIRMQVGEEM